MATPFVYKNAYLSVGGNDLSTYLKSVSFTYEYEEVDSTAMGDTARDAMPGMINWSMDVTVNQSITNSEVDDLVWAMVGQGSQAIIFKANGSSTSANNPKWTGNGQIFSYNAFGGSVGDGAEASFTIKPAGGSGLTRAESD